ncbi:hypothetical protein QBC32DRAFT_368517 [Pseudoneurospora amorphoporcata]|uniref:C2H2-type domain-containing protein n=1 Tax=Pseudoneurospora amorphoporcata TaxID=241081 RepID=A0AAN6NYS1_9PEZI|nr:hypothetical protein QBC32DRAFT_368517 [Pseudoneurospora amorphoporcata]
MGIMTDHQATLAHPESFSSRTRKVTTSLPPFTLPALDIPSTRNPYRAFPVLGSPSDSAFGDHNRQRWTTTVPKAAALTSPSPYPPPLTHSIPQPFTTSQITTSTTTTTNNSNLTTASGSEIAAEGLILSSSINSSGSQSSQQPYYSNTLTGSWPTPGSSSQSAYTYLSPDSNPGSGSLTQTSYTHRPQANFGSVPSSVTNYSGGRTTSTSTNAETVPASSSYQEQHSFPTSVGSSGGPLGSSHPPQASGLTQPMLSSQNPAVTQPPSAGHSSSLPSLDFGNFRASTSQNSYYPSATQQQPQNSTQSSYYPSPSTPQQGSYPGFQGAPPSQLSPTGYSPSTSQANASRGLGSISSSGSSGSGLQYGSRPQQYGLQSHHPYSLNGHGPVMSNMHQPGTPLAMVGMSGIHYGTHHPMTQYHRYGASHEQLGPRQGDRPYKCDQCTQGFNRNHDLKRHKRIHLATKPYPCGNCEKSFSRKDALKRHRLVKGCGKNDQVNGSNTKPGGTTTDNNTRPPNDYSVGSRASPMERIDESASDDAAVVRLAT